MRFSVSTRSLTSLTVLFGVVQVSEADNPIVQDIYTADPAPLVYDDKVWLFTGHDTDGATGYRMYDWRLFSSSDMVNWQHHPSPLDLTTFSWATKNAWAAQTIRRNGKFYFYAPVYDGATGRMSIGVAVSDNIAGPYTDPIGGPLVENNEIDPTVFIDDDGQAYLYWGNPNLSYVKLNEDMISYSGNITQVGLTTAGFGERTGDSERPTAFEEGPWLHKRDDIYYLSYPANCCPEDLRYSTGPSATGPWTYRGIIQPAAGSSSTNHPGIIDFAGNSYIFYHTSALPGGGSFTRSVSVESFEYNADGSIPEIPWTTEGPAQVANFDPFVRQEAETFAWSEGIEVYQHADGGTHLADIHNGEYVKVKGVAFSNSGAKSFAATYTSGTSGGSIELHIDSLSGTIIGTCELPGTGGWENWEAVSCDVEGATGTHDLFLKFVGGDGLLFDFDWWQFTAA